MYCISKTLNRKFATERLHTYARVNRQSTTLHVTGIYMRETQIIFQSNTGEIAS